MLKAAVNLSPVSGRGLFATEDLGAGELIFTNPRPTVSVLSNLQLQDYCSNCFVQGDDSVGAAERDNQRTPVKLKTCTGCRLLRYCSKACQSYAWKNHHKAECNLFKALSCLGELPHVARAVLQMLELSESETRNPFIELSSHFEDMKKHGDDKLEKSLLLGKGIHQYSKTKLSLEYVQSCFALAFTNCLTLMTATFDPIGACLDPFAAMANHSCEPNAISVFDGPALSFRTIGPIPKDEEIFITYIDGTNPFYRRQQELKEKYYFECKCIKCHEGPNTLFNFFLMDPKELDEAVDEIINRCSEMDSKHLTDESSKDYIGPDSVSQKLALIQRFAFDKLKEADMANELSDSLSLLHAGLNVCSPGVIWPVSRQPVPSLMQQKFVKLIGPDSWIECFKTGMEVYFLDQQLLPLSFHPMRIAHTFTMAMVVFHLSSLSMELANEDIFRFQVEQGVIYGVVWLGLMKEVQENVGRSHGESSTFAKAVKTKLDNEKSNMESQSPGLSGLFEEQIQEQFDRLRHLLVADSNGRMLQE